MSDDARHDAEGAILFWLEQASLGARAAILAGFRDRGHTISPGQWAVLNALWRGDGVPQTTVARRAGRDKPGVTRLLDRLEREGLVERSPSPTDRRATLVHLTDAGRTLHAVLHEVIDEVAATALEGASKAEREALRAGLRALTLQLKAARDG